MILDGLSSSFFLSCLSSSMSVNLQRKKIFCIFKELKYAHGQSWQRDYWQCIFYWAQIGTVKHRGLALGFWSDIFKAYQGVTCSNLGKYNWITNSILVAGSWSTFHLEIIGKKGSAPWVVDSLLADQTSPSSGKRVDTVKIVAFLFEYLTCYIVDRLF